MNRSFPEVVFCLSLWSSVLHAAEPLKVRTVKPETVSTGSSIMATGRTGPVQEAVLHARATGTLAERKVDIGDRVRKGDVLAVIAAPELSHQIAAAKAKVKQMEARAELAALLEERGEALAGNNAFSKEQLDERRSAAKITDADLASAHAELRQLEEISGFLTIRAPFDGTITARRVDVGDQITGDPANPESWLFRISRLDELRMILHVPPTTALRIGKDDPATVSFVDLPGREFEGKVARSSGVIESQSGTMRVELLLPNSDHALPGGLSGMAKIHTRSDSPVMMVPSNAVLTRDGVPNLALVDGGKVKFLPVKPGRTFGSKTEILSELGQEREVILSPNALLKEGDEVDPTQGG